MSILKVHEIFPFSGFKIPNNCKVKSFNISFIIFLRQSPTQPLFELDDDQPFRFPVFLFYRYVERADRIARVHSNFAKVGNGNCMCDITYCKSIRYWISVQNIAATLHFFRLNWMPGMHARTVRWGNELLATTFPRLPQLAFFPYRKTLVYVHTTRRITTVHHKARVARAAEKKKKNK